MSWNQENYIKAWDFASHAHNGQLLPGSETPYINHIGLVAMEAMAAITQTQVDNPDLLISCALLHDTIEDTNVTYEEVEKVFGKNVADGVLALSKNEDLGNKQVQMEDSLERILLQPKEVWMVKLSDRISNLQKPPKYWDQDKIRNYNKEAVTTLETLGKSNDYLATRLSEKIEAYKQYET